MSTFAQEVVKAIDTIKKNASEGTELGQEDLTCLFLASLLEEESNGGH